MVRHGGNVGPIYVFVVSAAGRGAALNSVPRLAIASLPFLGWISALQIGVPGIGLEETSSPSHLPRLRLDTVQYIKVLFLLGVVRHKLATWIPRRKPLWALAALEVKN